MNYIEIGGKILPIAFGYGALMNYEKSAGQPATVLVAQFSSGEHSITEVIRLLACGLENGSRKAGNPQPFPIEIVADLLDESQNPGDVIGRAMQYLADSFAQPSEGAKKKPLTTAKKPRLSGVR